jgi:hypothetical protein
MIHLKLLDEFSPEQLDLMPVEGRDRLLSATRFRYEAVGEVPYGIVGIVAASMMTREAIVWFLPYANIRPSWQERKAAKAFNLAGAIGFRPLADIHVENTTAAKFAQFFGLRKQFTDGEYHRYAGEN